MDCAARVNEHRERVRRRGDGLKNCHRVVGVRLDERVGNTLALRRVEGVALVAFAGLDPVARESVVHLTVLAEAHGKTDVREARVVAPVASHVLSEVVPALMRGRCAL